MSPLDFARHCCLYKIASNLLAFVTPARFDAGEMLSTHRGLKKIDYLQVLFFIIEPRGLKFDMRM